MEASVNKQNPLKILESLGQSIWLDYIERDIIQSGKLKKIIHEYDIRGMTSNPSIFEKAIANDKTYDQDIRDLMKKHKNLSEIYENLTQQDVRSSADLFKDLYAKSKGRDGYVSLEVNPHLANNAKETIIEARRLWKALDRPNVMIKVPATKEGLLAIKQLTSEGINVNITLLFGLPRYREVAEAYIAGLEERYASGNSIESIASVASFFLSRIDVLVDPLLEKQNNNDSDRGKIASEIHGQVAIASARYAYQIFLEIFNSQRFKHLMSKGAKVQRLLWASTSTKNPAYSDVKYVEALIGKETVNTLPMETLEAYRDHGKPEERIQQDLDKAYWVFKKLPELGIDIDKITEQLLMEGLDKFNQSFDQLLNVLREKL